MCGGSSNHKKHKRHKRHKTEKTERVKSNLFKTDISKLFKTENLFGPLVSFVPFVVKLFA
jgi:hypothetical protein